MNLIISGQLVNPPTEILYFRFLTLETSAIFRNLLKIPAEFRDVYLAFLKKTGGIDYLADFIFKTEDETGIFLISAKDCFDIPIINPVIKEEKITCLNEKIILRKIIALAGTA